MSLEVIDTKTADFVAVLRKGLESGTGALPVLPRAAEAALRLAQSPNVDFDKVVLVAESDPPLAARFLGVANSALYFRGVSIRSIKGALVRLGTQATRDVLYMAVYSGTLFKVPRYQALVEATFRHSIVVARAARRLAEVTGDDSETAFLAGLLHDVGRARCLKLAARYHNKAPGKERVSAAVGALHEEAGGQLAAAWHLPDEVIDACRYHHDPGDRPAVLRVRAADQLAYHVADPSTASLQEVLEAFAAAGVNDDEAGHLIDVAREDVFLVDRRRPF